MPLRRPGTRLQHYVADAELVATRRRQPTVNAALTAWLNGGDSRSVELLDGFKVDLGHAPC
jgi:hypothetical protein